jgi:2-polyprenyl-6-methoxyphenol hydroxylase-like FAD-dependent oxidoreductase
MSDDNRVLIAGGGLGGLTAALALRKVGFDPLVLEAAPRLLPFGSVLQLWPVGVQGLRAVGIGDDVVALSGWIGALEFRNQKGKLLMRAELEDVKDSIAVSRVELHETLGRAVGDSAIRTGSPVVGFEQDDDGVTAQLADGREERGRVLIGADGLESSLRERIGGPVRHRYVGKGWGGIGHVDNPPIPLGVSWQLFGRGKRAGVLHAKPGVVAWNTVAAVPEDADLGGKEQALELYRGWADPLEAALDSVPADQFFLRSIRDFEPSTTWGAGRVTLLGDAAHATTPAQGRGVSEAVEDAVVLANRLGRVGDLSDGSRTSAALRSYEQKRQPATRDVTENSLRVMRMSLLSNPVKIAGRNAFFRVAGGYLAKKMLEDAHRTIEPLEAGAAPTVSAPIG